MTIEAERLESWIGAEVCDATGEKLGKLGEVYFKGDDPLAVDIKSGLGGRKHHVAVLRGARVSANSVRLSVAGDALVATDGTLDDAALDALAAQDPALGDLQAADVEGYQAREQRLAAAAAAAAEAQRLEEEATRAKRAEEDAASKASQAGDAVEQARKAREEAEAKARKAREEAQAQNP